jgi:hypothetical protein
MNACKVIIALGISYITEIYNYLLFCKIKEWANQSSKEKWGIVANVIGTVITTGRINLSSAFLELTSSLGFFQR